MAQSVRSQGPRSSHVLDRRAMAHPLVVHCKRSRYDVYVGRPSPWGNPFRLTKESDRDLVVQRYESWLLGQPALVAKARFELAGKVLACWCAPKACHADVLARVANEVDQTNGSLGLDQGDP